MTLPQVPVSNHPLGDEPFCNSQYCLNSIALINNFKFKIKENFRIENQREQKITMQCTDIFKAQKPRKTLTKAWQLISFPFGKAMTDNLPGSESFLTICLRS